MPMPRSDGGTTPLCSIAMTMTSGVASQLLALVQLPSPLRAYDSRTADGPLSPNQTRTISLATGKDGAQAIKLAVPAGATGAIVTLTVTDTTVGVGGPGGFLTMYSAALPTPPSTSSINWTGAGQNLAVSTQTTVDASGSVKITDGANSTNFVIDVLGYTF